MVMYLLLSIIIISYLFHFPLVVKLREVSVLRSWPSWKVFFLSRCLAQRIICLRELPVYKKSSICLREMSILERVCLREMLIFIREWTVLDSNENFLS